MSALDVYLHGRLAGHLTRVSASRIDFRYTESWISSGGPPLSISLPLREEPFGDEEARPFFAGLLPEGAFLEAVARAFQVSADNPFALLEAIGGECAGAVSLVPSGESQPETLPPVWLTGEELCDLVKQLPRRPLHASRGESLRLSLAGAQHKLPVIFGGGRFGITRGDRPSTHILKIPRPEFEWLAENEAFCLSLARASGLDAVDAFVRYLDSPVAPDSSSTRALQVRRYDRQEIDGATHRLHQEDFCQALSRLPAEKYEAEGGPGVADCTDLIYRVSAVPAADMLSFADALLFNLAIGNRDAHAKNFSILLEGRRSPRLAPLYDLVCTTAYEFDPKMAMKMGGERRADYFYERHLERLAATLRMTAPGLRRRTRDLCDRIEAALDDPRLREPFPSEFLSSPVFEGIDQWIGRGIGQLRRASGGP